MFGAQKVTSFTQHFSTEIARFHVVRKNVKKGTRTLKSFPDGLGVLFWLYLWFGEILRDTLSAATRRAFSMASPPGRWVSGLESSFIFSSVSSLLLISAIAFSQLVLVVQHLQTVELPLRNHCHGILELADASVMDKGPASA